MVHFSQVVKAKRETMGLTQKEFAELVGVSGSCIARYENGSDISEVIIKQIRYQLRLLEDDMEPRERYTYEVIKEARLLALEPNDALLCEKLDNVMFACLKLRKYVNNKDR